MPSATVSSNKSFRRLLLFSCLPVAAFYAALFSFFSVQDRAKRAKLASPDAQVRNLLRLADSSISLSPGFAHQMAWKAFSMALSQKDELHMVRSWIMLGRINNLKALHPKALLFYDKALQLARKRSYTMEECEALLRTGEIFYKDGEYDTSFLWFNKADSLAARHGFEALRAHALFYTGKYHQTKGHFSLAKRNYLLALGIARKVSHTELVLLILPSLGKNYISEGNLQEALGTYQEAYYLSSEINNRLLSADICNHLGSLYLRIDEFDKAMLYHRKALNHRLSMNYPDGLAKSYNNIGLVFFERRQADSARYYFNKSLSICKNIRYKKGTIKALDNLGKVNLMERKTEMASRYFFEAFELATSAGYDVGMAESSLDLGDLYRQSGKYEKAIEYYLVSLNTLLRTGFDNTLLEVYRGLYESYNARRDYSKALAYHVRLLEVEKKLLDVENKRQLAILSMTFDTERKEKDYQVLVKENELKASQLKKNTIALWLVAAVLSFTILLCLYIYNRFYLKKKANTQLEELNHKITLQNAELEELNKTLSQVSMEKDKLFSIISHELRNPLYWLQNLAEVLSRKYQSMTPEKIKKSLLSLDESAKNVYHLMDNLLHWSRSKLNRIHPRKGSHELYELVRETTHMYETFFCQKEIAFYNDLPQGILIYADADLFGCVIRNLVSNAIKYTPRGGEVRITCRLNGGDVIVVVSDSGKGIDTSDLQAIFASKADHISMPGLMQEKGSGLGLKLCRDFAEMNNGKIWADSQPGRGTQVFFTVPLNRQLSAKRKLHEDPVEIPMDL